MKNALAIVVGLALIFPIAASAQSLADVAKKEAERRAAVTQPAKTITGDDIPKPRPADDGTPMMPTLDPLPPDPAGSGKWSVTSTTNPLNDHPIVTALLHAESPIKGWLATSVPTLVVRCQTPVKEFKFPAMMPIERGLEVYIVTDMAATVENGEGKHTLEVRFDDGPAQSVGSSESTDKKALFIGPIDSTKLLITERTLLTSRRMLVGFTPFNSSPVVANFDVRGFRTHVERILSACPPTNRSAWKFPHGYFE